MTEQMSFQKRFEFLIRYFWNWVERAIDHLSFTISVLLGVVVTKTRKGKGKG